MCDVTYHTLGNRECGEGPGEYPYGRIERGQLRFHALHMFCSRRHSVKRFCRRTCSSCGDGSWNCGVLARKLATLARM